MGMNDSTAQRQLLGTVQAELRPGESLLGLFPALTPNGSDSGLAPAELWPLIWAAEHLLRHRRDRAASQTSMFPLSTRMIMVLTEERLLIWAAGRRWRPAQFLGFVTRDRILQASTRTTGSGWRTVELHLANEPAIAVQVPATAVGPLVSALSGSRAEPPPLEQPHGTGDTET
jgi:hypothetical protein